MASGKTPTGNLKPMSTRRNPLAGIAMSGPDDEEKWKESVCSTLTGEQLAGTARGGNVILALEHPRGWGRDILDGEALGAEQLGRLEHPQLDVGEPDSSESVCRAGRTHRSCLWGSRG